MDGGSRVSWRGFVAKDGEGVGVYSGKGDLLCNMNIEKRGSDQTRRMEWSSCKSNSSA